MAEQDFYKTLGIDRSTSQKDVKKAYRKLARQFHPDVNPGDEAAEERFKDVAGAFDVLGDADKRKLYDEFGVEGLRDGFDPNQARTYQRWSQGARSGGGHEFRNAGPDFRDYSDLGSVFGDLFGGRFRQQPRGPQRGTDIDSSISVDFLTAIRGGEVNISLDRSQACSTCAGTGHQNGTGGTCSGCGGTGQQRVAQGPIDLNIPCEQCGGNGQEPGPPCHTCHGTGNVRAANRLVVKVPAGIADGGRIRLSGQGNPGSQGGPAGDLLLTINVKEHKSISRNGNNLEMNVPITIGEAVLGAKIALATPDGGSINLTIPKRSQSGQRMRLKGKGAPDPKAGARGDLYVTLDIKIPTNDSEEIEQLARTLDEHYRDEALRPSSL